MMLRAIILVAIWLGLCTSSAFAQRQPIPKAEQLAEANKLVASIYEKELEAAKSPSAQLTLAKKLLADAQGTRDDPASQFALAERARQLAGKAGKFDMVREAADFTASKFEVDALALKQQALAELVAGVKEPGPAYEVLCVTHDVLEEALQAMRMDSAQALSDLLPKLASRINDQQLRRQIEGRCAEVRNILAQWPKYQAAQEVLPTQPGDGAANHDTGVLLVMLGQWDKALPYLALSSQKPLPTLAEQELKGASKAEEAAALVEGWWAYSQGRDGWLKAQCQIRALHHMKARWTAFSPLIKTKFANYIEVFQDEQALSLARWYVYRFDHAQPTPWHVRLNGPRGQGLYPSITSIIEYRGPLDITAVARTDSNNIRIAAYGKAEIIWNWELNRDELRAHRPDGGISAKGTKALEIGRFYTLRWIYGADAMRVLVNGNLIFSERWRDELPPNVVRVYAMESTVDVRSLTIKPLVK